MSEQNAATEYAREAIRTELIEPSTRIILALDNMAWEQAEELMEELGPYIGMAKSKSLSIRRGTDYAVERTGEHGLTLMEDRKFHDTDRTMADSVTETTAAGARFITMHGSNKLSSLEAAVKARNLVRDELQSPLAGTLLGITVLTTFDNETCEETYGRYVPEKVMQFARRSDQSGAEAIVCAVEDLDMLQSDPVTRRLLKVTPGIVLSGQAKPSGQERVATARSAIEGGADFIVVGSAVTKAANRVEAAQEVLEEVTEALAA